MKGKFRWGEALKHSDLSNNPCVVSGIKIRPSLWAGRECVLCHWAVPCTKIAVGERTKAYLAHMMPVCELGTWWFIVQQFIHCLTWPEHLFAVSGISALLHHLKCWCCLLLFGVWSNPERHTQNTVALPLSLSFTHSEAETKVRLEALNRSFLFSYFNLSFLRQKLAKANLFMKIVKYNWDFC